ncbi:glycosyltransferase family 4 protein [Mucilaginibacter pallidiroseus]|uniref:Glycosyltransferase family 4 protein n=1 Tax=Mucilaginibacter pallidiroseus TaxID=2599295 RepID=A0A563U3H3_9SPHI|nr:glycosyltransferase [Mucilaginibacter pallidiroseus]TWR25897.1 glycosyltransferase family 4 protein [Mucilaginibacter pallidiroseus]
MKILIVAGPFVSLREPYNGGTEAFIIEHANQLVKLGHDVDVIAKDADEKNLFQVIAFPESPLSMKDDSYRPVTEEKGQQNFQSLQYGIFDVSVYDVIHYNSYIPEIYAIGALFNKPAVLTLHLPPTERFVLMYKFFIKHAPVTPIAISNRMSQQWQKALGRDLEVVLNGIPLERWKVQPKNAQGYLLWSGRIAKEKNIEAAINLANHLKQPLKIVGAIFDNAYFNDSVKPHLNENIKYIAHVTQQKLGDLVAGASAFLATATWEEPFGLSTAEMLASGLPVVGFNTAIPPELRHERVSIAVDSNNWEDLVAPLGAVKSVNPEECRTFAASFDVTKTAEAYVNVYKRAVQERRNS